MKEQDTYKEMRQLLDTLSPDNGERMPERFADRIEQRLSAEMAKVQEVVKAEVVEEITKKPRHRTYWAAAASLAALLLCGAGYLAIQDNTPTQPALLASGEQTSPLHDAHQAPEEANPISPINPINPLTPNSPINPITPQSPITPISKATPIPSSQNAIDQAEMEAEDAGYYVVENEQEAAGILESIFGRLEGEMLAEASSLRSIGDEYELQQVDCLINSSNIEIITDHENERNI